MFFWLALDLTLAAEKAEDRQVVVVLRRKVKMTCNWELRMMF